ncbi:L-serine ammonia-lyase [Aurantiacibacter luteus]|uniref:L-serine dehydratase n=1 Tax=Aurantiacibacter luteus TaxID=1581420 RepID=A0A0G9MYB7_9SPHN|nr:L-serine ammonia-lyase [Aurantiacibacter luteus]KLE34263.1 serine dehydratase [Aurantiacibacter luteus]
MSVSLFELFKVGIGPSSSHTVGPMVAARRFGEWLYEAGLMEAVARVRVDLYGSLALTGKGHATDTAVVLGLAGEHPATIDPDAADSIVAAVCESGRITLFGRHEASFSPNIDIRFRQRERKPFHTNAMAFEVADAAGEMLARRIYYSIGGGFVVDEDEAGINSASPMDAGIPHDFENGAQLLTMCEAEKVSIAELMLRNECALRPLEEVEAGIDAIAAAMTACIERGCRETGVLPGGLEVKRRAPAIAAELRARQEASLSEPLGTLDWINLWAMAVNEENAAGGRVVTAPTNGAAGIIPAVLRYYERCYRGSTEGKRTFLLTAAAIGALYKRNASISGAEVGCQGEVGVACSMAAAGLTAVLGGTPAQVENAAEIGMEHNLGLTCDPIGGLVQIPCIERNAMGAVKAIDASRLALMGDGSHMVSLDKVIATMWQTGRDMRDKYKETSKGGLAVNVVEC